MHAGQHIQGHEGGTDLPDIPLLLDDGVLSQGVKIVYGEEEEFIERKGTQNIKNSFKHP